METMPYFASDEKNAIVIFENGKVRTYILDSRSQWTVGRQTPENFPDIVLHSNIAGRKQGKLIYIGDQWFWVNGESRNGTFYNGRKISVEKNRSIRPILLNNGDVLRVDSDMLNSPDGVWILFTTDNVDGNWIFYTLNNRKTVVIGRKPEECDIVLEQPYISAKHAKITYLNGKYYISDCQSSAGTWVNGERVFTSLALKEKDRISLCDYNFIYSGGNLIYNVKNNNKQSAMVKQNKILLDVDIKSKKVPSSKGHGFKELIHNVKLDIREGALVALLGGSGAGKSTLMNCINGMDINGVSGTVLFNNENLYENFDRLKFLIGSVPQSNVFHDMLTVEEEFREAAIMKLPCDMTKNEINRRVDETIHLLGLDLVRKSKNCKLSGGEQKRVNIGIDLVADRKLLCLDEPDAGLDPKRKTELFMILKNLAHSHDKCVIAIIHDVSDIELFDQVIMMVKTDNVGRLAFSGSPSDAKNYFGVELKDVYSLIEENPQKYLW